METITNMAKKSMGRQKIEIKKIEKKSNLQVTFSKRRAGLFKKVGELAALYGVSAAVVVESPGGKIFTFGTPSVEHVIDKYVGMQKDDQVCTQVERYEGVKKDDQELHGGVKNDQELHGGDLFWWRKEIDDMGLEELEEYRDALLKLKSNVMGMAGRANFSSRN